MGWVGSNAAIGYRILDDGREVYSVLIKMDRLN